MKKIGLFRDGKIVNIIEAPNFDEKNEREKWLFDETVESIYLLLLNSILKENEEIKLVDD